MKIAIEVSGGVVQSVVSDSEDIDIRVYDYDNEPDLEPPQNEEFPVALL